MTTDTNFVCDVCWQSFDTLAAVNDHLRDEHDVEDPVEVGSLDQSGENLVLKSGDKTTVIDLEQWLKENLGDD